MLNGEIRPVYDYQITLSKPDPMKPINPDPETKTTIGGMESFSVAIDNGVETCRPLEMKGFQRALKTALGMTITLNGKRVFGDKGNDMLANEFMFANGKDAYAFLEATDPNGGILTAHVVVNVTSFGGDSTNIDGLEVELICDGRPEYQPAPSRGE